jgi:hypothetical protein
MSALAKLSSCLEYHQAMDERKRTSLQLYSSKTEALLIGTPKEVTSAGNICPTINGQATHLSTVTSNLGVRLDPSLFA